MTELALPALVFGPLLAAAAAAVLPARAGRALALLTVAALPVALIALLPGVLAEGVIELAMAGFSAPLGIVLRVDGLGLLMLALTWVVMLAATVHAAGSITKDARRFWPPWLMLLTGLHTMLVSGDLFNIYVGLELLTISAVALVAFDGSPQALRAAMRTLLLAMLGSLAYLLGVAVIHASTGTVDLLLAARRAPPGLLGLAPILLMGAGLALKAAIFPLHGWLPAAHASAPGPVSAVLSALVVKASLVVLIRVWFLGQTSLPPGASGQVWALMGVGAILFGSLMALRQVRLKRLVTYSMVAQLGYIMLLFAMPVVAAWQGAVYQMLSHGLAKAAMFLATADLMKRLGGDELSRLPGADRAVPISAFAFGLAGVSLIGLPPSGGFLAKWLLLTAAWELGQWWIVAVVMVGSLLAAAYLFRVLGLMFSRPAGPEALAEEDRRAPLGSGLPALALAILAIAAGFSSAPVFKLLGAAPFAVGGP